MEKHRPLVHNSDAAIPPRPPVESQGTAGEAARSLVEAAGAELRDVGLTEADVRRLAEKFVAGGGQNPHDFVAWVYQKRAHKQLGEPPGS